MPKITQVEIHDVRFPNSQSADGSDAVHPDPDYSVAYVILHTEQAGLEGHGYTFTIGRGTEVVVSAIKALQHHLVGRSLSSITDDWVRFWRALTQDTQLRWIGPEKGAIHLATAAIVNAIWDLECRFVGKPLWQLLTDLSPEELVRRVDFKYISDAITPEEAVAMLRQLEPSKAARQAQMLSNGYPAYTTAAGWLGYDDDKIRRLAGMYLEQGWSHFKMKVGGDLEDDLRRARLLRQIIGSERKLMMDANQRWDVQEAIEAMQVLSEVNPWWIEEPTSADDVLGHATVAKAVHPVGVATGEHAQNRVIFKQLMQSNAIQFCQVDACRMGGVNEWLAVLLMAAKFGIPVCPHAGGVGLCECVQHISIFDYIAVSGSLENRLTEYANHLEAHYLNPAQVRGGRYLAPLKAGYGARLHSQSIAEHEFPNGAVWASRMLKEE
jgi:L-fuconate dehydratase